MSREARVLRSAAGNPTWRKTDKSLLDRETGEYRELYDSRRNERPKALKIDGWRSNPRWPFG